MPVSGCRNAAAAAYKYAVLDPAVVPFPPSLSLPSKRPIEFHHNLQIYQFLNLFFKYSFIQNGSRLLLRCFLPVPCGPVQLPEELNHPRTPC
ncbi:hypothetical protein BDV12DRAFT_140530 [Aspergillus spectabilis]